jgi:hypothetical protein
MAPLPSTLTDLSPHEQAASGGSSPSLTSTACFGLLLEEEALLDKLLDKQLLDELLEELLEELLLLALEEALPSLAQQQTAAQSRMQVCNAVSAPVGTSPRIPPPPAPQQEGMVAASSLENQ